METILGYPVVRVNDLGEIKDLQITLGKSLLDYSPAEFMELLKKGTVIKCEIDYFDWDSYYWLLTRNHWYKKGYGLTGEIQLSKEWKEGFYEKFRELSLRAMWMDMKKYYGLIEGVTRIRQEKPWKWIY